MKEIKPEDRPMIAYKAMKVHFLSLDPPMEKEWPEVQARAICKIHGCHVDPIYRGGRIVQWIIQLIGGGEPDWDCFIPGDQVHQQGDMGYFFYNPYYGLPVTGGDLTEKEWNVVILDRSNSRDPDEHTNIRRQADLMAEEARLIRDAIEKNREILS
jgi:hypothetical protein